jgi:hypothetical protein
MTNDGQGWNSKSGNLASAIGYLLLRAVRASR